MDRIEDKEILHIIKSLVNMREKLRTRKDELRNVSIEHIRNELIISVDKEIKFNEDILTKLYERREENK